MKIGRAVVGAAFLASLALLTGCPGSKSPGTDTTSPPARSASDELADAMRTLGSTSYSFAMTFAGGEMTGAIDPAKNAVKVSIRVAEAGKSSVIDLVLVDPDMYVKVDGLALPGVTAGKFLHLDATKVKSLSRFGVDDLDDPTRSVQLMQSLVSVERAGAGSFKGTVDLTKIEGLDEDIKALGDKAKAVPFEARVDSGRITRMTIDMPAAGSSPAGTLDIKYFDFGSATTISKPVEGEVVPATDAIYRLVNDWY